MDRCLNHSVVSDLLEDNPEFGSLVDQSGQMYTSLMANEMTVESALASDMLNQIKVSIGTRKEELVSR